MGILSLRQSRPRRAFVGARAVFALYFILSAFTFTRIAGIPFKRLKLFKGMVYTAAVFTATMITSAMAFGQLGPFSLYCFLIGYAVYATHCKKVHSAKVTRKMETKWDSVSQRNPFDFKAEAPNSLMRKSLDSALSQSAEGRARIDKAQLARLLCPSGVVMSEVEKSFAELCDDKSEGIAFAVFLQRLPSVWQWYFEYMGEAVANFDERGQ